ncbi:DUF2155 domain-containing protein [Bombella saccharophila]|uniref:DUF2155 domain-containing protein n=1 Tax=Bombella saccharophila TaxID=2967338 RepID=A0ABT3W5Y6_9PROT|nr:DUF2155 domain-containing protein [Bombella saccharophila]MCX5614472.1 DUF2155 domain-containing protein [Bombella saccharophila]
MMISIESVKLHLRGMMACLVGSVLGGGLPALHAEGVRAVAPPAMYPATSWQGRNQAVMRIMRRLDSHVGLVSLHVGEVVQYGTLSLTLERCLQKPEGLPAQAAAQVKIEENQEAGSPTFEGWMFTNDPALGAYAGALYDVQVVSCDGDAVAPMVGPLPHPSVPSVATAGAPHVEADGEGKSSSPTAGQNVHQGDNGASGPVSLLPPTPAPAPQAGQGEGTQP